MSLPLAYLNGRFISFAEAGLPLHDAGFVSGATIVDNCRTFKHQPFLWPDHLTRFRRDCELCYVPLEASDDQITAAAQELVEHNAKLLPPGGELQLVTFATPGPLGFYLGESTSGPPTLGMATYPLPFARYRRFFEEGASLAIAGNQLSATTDLLPPRVKHRSRLFWHIAERRLRNSDDILHHPTAIPVVINQDGAADTAIGALLVVCGETVVALDPATVQESISVRVVATLCERLGIPFEVAPVDFRGLSYAVEFPEADAERCGVGPVTEMLFTGTGFCLAGVREFSFMRASRTYPWPGPIYQKLLAAWSELVEVDIAGQFTSNA